MPSRECYLPIRLSSEAPDHGNSFISELFELTLQLQTVAESIKMDGCGKCFAGSAFFWIGQKEICRNRPKWSRISLIPYQRFVGPFNDLRHSNLISEGRAKRGGVRGFVRRRVQRGPKFADVQ